VITFGLNEAGGTIAGGLGAGDVVTAATPIASVRRRGGGSRTGGGWLRDKFRELTPEELLDIEKFYAQAGQRRAARRSPRARSMNADRATRIRVEEKPVKIRPFQRETLATAAPEPRAGTSPIVIGLAVVGALALLVLLLRRR